MTPEYKKIEINKEEWEQFLDAAEEAFDIAERDTAAKDFGFTVFANASFILSDLRKCLPVLARDAEQLPRLRLKRKNQRIAYRNLQTAYEKLLRLWQDLHTERAVEGVFGQFIGIEIIENGNGASHEKAKQPKDAA